MPVTTVANPFAGVAPAASDAAAERAAAAARRSGVPTTSPQAAPLPASAPTTSPRPANDSLGPAYQAHVQDRQTTSDADAERAAALARRAAASPGAASGPPGTGTAAPAAGAAPAAAATEPPSAGSPQATAAAAAEEPGFLHRLGTNLQNPMAAMRASIPLGAAALAHGAADVAEGATFGAIPAVLGGARDATQHTLELIKSTGDWLDQNVAHLPLPQSLQGAAEMPAQLPGAGTLTGTATESLLRTGAEYLTGFALGGKVMDAVKAGEIAGPAVANVGKGVVADFAAMDPKGERLTNLWSKLGLPANVVTDWLAAKPGDTEIEGRFKNALEGAGLGALAGGVGRAADAWKAAREAVAGGPGAVVDAATAGAPKVSLEELKAKLGDPESQAFVRRNQPAAAAPEAAASPDAAAAASETAAPSASPAAPPETGAGIVPRRPGQTLEQQAAAKVAPSVAATSPEALGVPTDVAAKGVAFAEHKPEFFINWSKIDAPEHVQNAIAQMADSYKGDIEAARRGEQTFEMTKLGAGAQNAWDILLSRRQGEVLNDQQSVAVRQLWATSGAKLGQLSIDAANNPSDANLFAYRKMMATHHLIQNEVLGARAEAARSFGSWRIPVGVGPDEGSRQLDWMLAEAGGTDLTREMAKRMAILARQGNVAGLDGMTEKEAQLTTMDAVRSVWVNMMLSAPPTHLANMGDNLVMAAQQVWERYGAEKISAALGQADGVAHGEALAMTYGMVSSWKDALRYAAKASMTGESGFGIGKVEEARPFALGRRADVGGDYAASGEFGRAVDYLGQMLRSPKVAIGETLNSPATALVAEDEFFKTIGYRAEVHAQSLRQATQEARSGAIANDPEAIGRRMAELVRDPPENIRMASVDQAMYATLNNAPGELGKTLIKLRDQLNVKGVPVGVLLMPFVKVPANALSYTLARTPLAPLMNTFSADIAAGGPRQALALSRLAAGSATMMAAADLAMAGLVTGSGPKDTASRAALPRDWQPYSVKGYDGRYYSFNRLGAVGNLLGIAADAVDVFHNTDLNRHGTAPVMPIMAASTLMVANDFLSKSYVQGLASVVDALSDPQRYGPKFFEGLAGSVVPGIVAGVTREMDPHAKDVRGMLDAIMARTPGLSDKVPNRLDLWGRPITYQSGLGGAYDMLSPVRATSGKTDEPIDKEIAKQGIAPTLPQRTVSFAPGAPPTDLEQFPGAYQRYQALAGNDAKHPEWGGMGAKDYLNAVVSGSHPMSTVYHMGTPGPDGGKSAFIRDVIAKARSQALVMLRQERPDVRVAVSRQMTTPRVQGVPAMPAVPMLQQ